MVRLDGTDDPLGTVSSEILVQLAIQEEMISVLPGISTRTSRVGLEHCVKFYPGHKCIR